MGLLGSADFEGLAVAVEAFGLHEVPAVLPMPFLPLPPFRLTCL